MSLDLLRTYNAERMDVETMIELSASAKLIASEFAAYGVALPEWFGPAQTSLTRAIKARVADDLAARLQKLQARREVLSTPDEKRSKLDAEIAALKDKLQSA